MKTFKIICLLVAPIIIAAICIGCIILQQKWNSKSFDISRFGGEIVNSDVVDWNILKNVETKDCIFDEKIKNALLWTKGSTLVYGQILQPRERGLPGLFSYEEIYGTYGIFIWRPHPKKTNKMQFVFYRMPKCFQYNNYKYSMKNNILTFQCLVDWKLFKTISLLLTVVMYLIILEILRPKEQNP